jgi:hypothetical protein
MKRALLVVVAACGEPAVPEPWQLDHDRVVAVRALPPHIAPGEIALFESLIAHADGPTTIEPIVNASAASAPGDLFLAVHYYFDHWQIDGPDQARLDAARAALGLAADAPVPLDVTLELPGPLYAAKTVWLGDSRANPPAPAITYGPVLGPGEYPLDFDPPFGGTVRWLTSCGTLLDHTEPRATHVVDEPCEGELVAVVRDGFGGVAWQVLPIRVE